MKGLPMLVSEPSTLTEIHGRDAGGPRGWLHLLTPKVFVRLVVRCCLVWGSIGLAAIEISLRRTTALEATRLAQRCARRILRIAGVTVHVTGEPPPGRGLIVANHRSYADILVMMSVIPCSFLCKSEVKRWPLLGRIAACMGVVFVDRSSRESRAAALSQVAHAVQTGITLTAFPEGTTSRGPGMNSTRPGLFHAAEQHEFKVTPAVIEYDDPADAWVDDDTLVRHCLFWLAKPSGRVTLCLGSSEGGRKQEPGQLQARVEDWMRSTLAAINGRPVNNIQR